MSLALIARMSEPGAAPKQYGNRFYYGTARVSKRISAAIYDPLHSGDGKYFEGGK